MARLPYVDPASASPNVRALLEALPVKLNLFRMLAHAESPFRPILETGAAILAQLSLSPAVRELAILRVATLSRAKYEWTQHVPIALACGVTSEQVAALERGEIQAGCFDAVEQAVLRFVTEVANDVRASDEALDRVSTALGVRAVVELLVVVGYYRLIAGVLETTGVDLDLPVISETKV
jgi:alkylhydroperoxidase family enzyme